MAHVPSEVQQSGPIAAVLNCNARRCFGRPAPFFASVFSPSAASAELGEAQISTDTAKSVVDISERMLVKSRGRAENQKCKCSLGLRDHGVQKNKRIFLFSRPRMRESE